MPLVTVGSISLNMLQGVNIWKILAKNTEQATALVSFIRESLGEVGFDIISNSHHITFGS